MPKVECRVKACVTIVTVADMYGPVTWFIKGVQDTG